jgi:hypothetical protein
MEVDFYCAFLNSKTPRDHLIRQSLCDKVHYFSLPLCEFLVVGKYTLGQKSYFLKHDNPHSGKSALLISFSGSVNTFAQKLRLICDCGHKMLLLTNL